MPQNSSKFTKVNINFLLCSLLTLSPNSNFFKIINIQGELFGDLLSDNSILVGVIEKGAATDFLMVLNTSSLRQTANIIIAPLLCQSYKTINNKALNTHEIKIIQKFLKKYRYIYNRYFLKKRSKYNNNTFNDRELNYFAIESLLLIVGA